MKCYKCGAVILDGECVECGHKLKPKRSDERGGDFYGVCSVCGDKKAKGRNIAEKKERPVYYCYYCYSERAAKGYKSTIKSFATKAEAAYNWATHEYYLKPSFYLEEPNYKLLDAAHDKMHGVVRI